jgi:hypothetical protein
MIERQFILLIEGFLLGHFSILPAVAVRGRQGARNFWSKAAARHQKSRTYGQGQSIAGKIDQLSFFLAFILV